MVAAMALRVSLAVCIGLGVAVIAAQAHAQVVMNLVDFGMHVQAAGEAARMRHKADQLALESSIGADVRAALERRGHVVGDGRGDMGGYQAVLIDPQTARSWAARTRARTDWPSAGERAPLRQSLTTRYARSSAARSRRPTRRAGT